MPMSQSTTSSESRGFVRALTRAAPVTRLTAGVPRLERGFELRVVVPQVARGSVARDRVAHRAIRLALGPRFQRLAPPAPETSAGEDALEPEKCSRSRRERQRR